MFYSNASGVTYTMCKCKDAREVAVQYTPTGSSGGMRCHDTRQDH